MSFKFLVLFSSHIQTLISSIPLLSPLDFKSIFFKLSPTSVFFLLLLLMMIMQMLM